MDEADLSEGTTDKQQEDVLSDETLLQSKICNEDDFTPKNGALDVSSQMISTGAGPQEKATPSEACRNTATGVPLDDVTKNGVSKIRDQEKQQAATLHTLANKGDTPRSNISDILLHHLSKEQFLRGQGIDCETLPEISNADSFEEAAIIKNIISCYVKNSWSKEQTSELTDQFNPKRDGEDSSKPSCSPITTEEHSSDLEESNFQTKIKGPSDKRKCCQGQAPRKQQTEKASSGHGLKYGQGQVHYQLPDLSKVITKVKIPKNNIMNKPLPSAQQASFSPKLRDKSAIVQDILDITPRSNCVEKQHQEQKRNITETSQQIQTEPTAHIHQELLTGLESETRLFMLSSASQKDPSSTPSIFQKISQGQQMCQKLKEQADRLKTKVQEFSKSLKQDSPCHLQDKRLMLEKLQGRLKLLEQTFLATKDQHLTLQQQDHRHESAVVGDFDPEREVEGEIFQVEMLLEDVKEKIDGSKYTSALPLPASSLVTLEDLASVSSSFSNEIPKEHPGHPPGLWTVHGSEATGTPRGRPQETPSDEELRQLASQSYLNGSSRTVVAQDQPDQAAPRLSSDSREDPKATPASQDCADTTAPGPSCASCRRLLAWKQQMEKKGHRRLGCGKFSMIIHKKAPHSASALSSGINCSFHSDSGTGLQSHQGEVCDSQSPDSRRVCGHKLPEEEFHYRYNSPGQNYLNHSERGALVQPRSLEERKNASPPYSKPKQICSQTVNSKSFQGQREPTPGKKNPWALMTCSSDLAAASLHSHSCRSSGSKSFCDLESTEETTIEILHSALDHALRTATVLKETTNQMIKTISEDLAKARRWRDQLKY
ncbi:protein AKNAD1 [Carlito syrichta]|uniref:Protein AKNAD1 n=1 Tax=Carlito syrichta TaxID=1868482 RepID=A0A1U7U6F8_CARSF|nr:protein AKNAD1 [Carlito syrichta]